MKWGKVIMPMHPMVMPIFLLIGLWVYFGIFGIARNPDQFFVVDVNTTEINDYVYVAKNNSNLAIEILHPDTPTKWVIPTYEDIKQCTNRELHNIAMFCSIGKCAGDVNDYLYFGNKLMPERFKVYEERIQQ